MARIFYRSCQLYQQSMEIKHPSIYAGLKPDSFWVLFVIDEGERNVCDQKWIENHLFDTYGVRSLRITLAQVHKRAERNEATGALILDETREVALVYYRTGY